MTSDDHLAEITRSPGRTTLHYTRGLGHEPESVWSVLTESAHMRWWMPVDMIGDRATGSTVRMVFWPDLVDKNGLDPDAGTATILACDPPNVFRWVWHGSQVGFDVSSTADGSRLSLLVELDADDPDTIVDSAAGHHLWLDHLVTLLDAGSCPPIADADAQPLEAEYRSRLPRP